jgi:hypothetical protein
MTLLRLFLLFLLPSLAFAGADLAPFNGAGGVQVSDTGKSAKVFYPVDPGKNLDYAFSGPGRVWVYVRSGERPKGSWNYPRDMELPLEVVSTRIDGVPLAPGLDNLSNLVDTQSTYPWLSKGILIDVPEGAESFRLAARLDGPALLVRIMVPGAATETAVAAAPEPTAPEPTTPDLLDDAFYGEEPTDPAEPAEASEEELASTDETDTDEIVTEETVADETATPEIIDAIPEHAETPPEETPPVGEDTFGGLYEIFDDQAQDLAEAAPTDSEEIVDLSAEEKEPEAVALGGFSDRLGHSFRGTRLSLSTGIGAPIQGDQAVASARIVGQMELFPLLSEAWEPGWGRLDLVLSAGWYRVGVNQSLVIPDAIAGDTQLVVAYATHVFPIALGFHYDLPLRLGPAVPFIGVGGGLNIVQRFGATPASALSAGWNTELGVLLPAGPISIAPSLRFNGASATLDRQTLSGQPAAENLSHFRLDLAVQTHF